MCLCTYGYVWDCVTVTLFDCVTEVCDLDAKLVWRQGTVYIPTVLMHLLHERSGRKVAYVGR